jgi:hypothetical protein
MNDLYKIASGFVIGIIMFEVVIVCLLAGITHAF